MPRNTKDSQFREDVDGRDDVEAPRVEDEEEAAEDDRAMSKLDQDAVEEEVGEEDLVEEIDLDELSAMEGPDA